LVIPIRGALLFPLQKGATMFFPALGISAAALALVQLGSLAATVLYLKALLAGAVAVAQLLGLTLLVRRHKDTNQ